MKEKRKNPLNLDPFTFCKVTQESESHYFKKDHHVYFDGEIKKDPETGVILYSMIGKVDGYTLRQWLDHSDFIIWKTFEQWTR